MSKPEDAANAWMEAAKPKPPVYSLEGPKFDLLRGILGESSPYQEVRDFGTHLARKYISRYKLKLERVDDVIKQTEGEEEKDITDMVQKQWEKVEKRKLKDKMLKLRGKDPTMNKDDLK